MTSYIKKFNPYDLSEETLDAIATGRERVLEDILGTIASNAEGGGVQHLQIVAPRGYGKSFLMRMVQSALRARVAEGLPAVLALLPEEQHNVDAPHRLLDEIRRLLEGRPADSLLGGAFAESDGAWDEALAALNAAIAARLPEGRGIAVAVVENFDQLMREVFRGAQDQSRLRKLLDRKGGRLMLLATATRCADAAYEQRLFRATRLIELEPWKEETCLTFFERLRGHRGAGELSPQLYAKAKALAQFIGGSPRMATVLAEVLENNDSLRVAQMLDALVDELTPYYKHRIESLSRRARTLLDALLRMGEPRTQSEIAARLGTVQARIAQPFDELRAGGEVVGVKAQHSAEILYRVGDRLMAHYYRKRHLGAGEGASLLEGIVEFLESFYTPEEKRAEAERLRAIGRTMDAAVFDRLIMANMAPIGGESPGLGSGDGWLEQLEKHLYALATEGQLDEALTLCWQAVKRAETSGKQSELSCSQRILGSTFGRMGRYAEAEAVLRRAIALAEQIGDRREQARASGLLGWVLGQMERHEEAEETLRRTIALAEQLSDRNRQVQASRSLGWVLSRMGRHEVAVETLRRAIALAEQSSNKSEQARASRHLGWTLGRMGRYAEAEEPLRLSTALAEQSKDRSEQQQSLNLLGWTLGQMGRYAEAKETLNHTFALAEQLGDAQAIAWSALELLRVAIAMGDDAAVVMAWHRVHAAVVAAPAKGGLPEIDSWFDAVAAAALRSAQFGTFWSACAALPVSSWKLVSAQSKLAKVVAAVSQTQGRAAAYALATQGIEILARDAVDRAPRKGIVGPDPIAFLSGLLSHLTLQLTDPALLRDIAALLEQRLPSETRAERIFLEAAAQLAEHRDDPAALERVDPDVATMLERMIGTRAKPPSKTSPRRGKRSSGSRRKK